MSKHLYPTDHIPSSAIRPVSEEQWPYEYALGALHDRQLVKAAVDWCEAQCDVDEQFEYCIHKTKEHEIHFDQMEFDDDAHRDHVMSHKFRRKTLGNFFYFKRAQDFMLFKLSLNTNSG